VDKRRGEEKRREETRRGDERVWLTHTEDTRTHTSRSNLYVYDQEDLEDIWCGQGEAVGVLCD
jgi:hypothetical protein